MDYPVLVFDDDCGFCTWWAEYVDNRSAVPIVGFTEVDDELRERLPDDWRECSHYVTAEEVYSCGASIEEALLRHSPARYVAPAVRPLRGLGPYRAVREWGYRRVANNRALFGRLMSRTPPVRRDD